MGGLGSLLFDIGASTVTLSNDVNRGLAITNSFVADANASLNRIGSGVNLNGVTAQIEGLKASFASVQSVAASALGVGIGAGLAKGAMDYADAWLLSGNRIRAVVGDASQVVAVQQQLFDVAQATGTEIDANAKTYQRLATVIASSGRDQAEASTQAIALTRELNEEIVVSGANVGEATHAVSDLVHGLAGGVLQARQFNPIMRQMPDLANQIAQGLGVSVKQLEEMVHAGLPAEQVLEALNNQAGVIHDRFTALPETFSRAWQQLDNSVERYVGTASEASTLTDTAKGAIVGLANNIDVVAKGAIAAGAATALWLGGKTLTALGGMSTAIYQVITAQSAYKTAAMVAAEADVASSRAQIAALAETVVKADAMNDLRIQERIAIDGKVTALATEIAALEREAVASNNVLAASERLIAVRAELDVATSRAAELENAMASAQAKATLAEEAQAAATLRLAAATQGLGVAQAEATSIMGLLSRGATGLLALVGGLPGVFLAAGVGLYFLVTAQSDAEVECGKLDKITRQLIESHGILEPALVHTGQAALQEAQYMARLAQAKADSAQKEAEAAQASNASTTEYEQAADAAQYYAAQAATLTEKANELAASLRFANVAAGVNGTALANWTDGIRGALAQIDELGTGLKKQADKMNEQAATYKMGHAAVLQYEKDQELTKLSVGATTQQIALLKQSLDEQYAPAIKAAQSLDAVTAAHKENTKELTAQQRALKDYNTDVGNLANLEDQLSSGLGGPYLAALKTYQKGIDETAKTWADAVAAGTANDELLGRLNKDQEMLGDTLDQTNKRIKDQHDLLTQSAKAITDEQVVLHALPQQQDAVRAGLDAYNKAMIDHIDLAGNFIADEELLKKALDEQLPGYVANKQALHDLDEQQKLNEQTAKDWVSVWQNAGDGVADTFSKILVEGGSLMDGLKSIAQQTVEAIISYFAKLAVINPILNAVFGGSAGFSLLPSLASAASGVAGGGGGNGYNWTVGADGGTEPAGGSDMFSTASNGVSLFNAGKTLYSGFQSGFDNFLFGSNSSASGWLGSYSANMYGPGGTFAPSALGYGVSIAGGVYAGYNEFNRAGGGAAGLAGGLSYGVGTTALGLGAASLATGGGLVAGLGALGPVGWAALALMAVDMISGGKLFGTAGKFNFGQSTIAVGADGATVSQGYDMKGQKALFGGSTHSWHDVTPDQAAVDAANAFYDALRTGAESFAKEFGVKVGDIVGGSFTQTFDKHGNVTATSDTVLGKTYSEDAQHFEERLDAENMIAVLAQFDAKLSDSMEQYRADADQLMAVTQALAQGEAMMQDGTTFLALGSDQSLSALLALAQGSVRFGETVDQTLQRIEQSQAQYTQFVAGFKPPTNYVDDFEASLAGIRDQMIANEKQANDLAIAAGAAGASEEDLANIQKYAVAQEKEAIKQLQASAQSLAFGMGLTSIGSLDEVNAEIAALQQQAGEATSPIANVGAAIRQTAQDATAALNLLLGDLSPLNDAQKLEKARAGLIAGQVTSDQFDEIARRLYGSSQQYVDEFNFAQQYAGRAGGTPGIPSGSQHQGLSPADQKRLGDLIKEQADLQKQQAITNAQTLAMQIAELAASKKEDFQQVEKEMGIDQQALEKILGLNDQQFAALIASDQAAKDDNGDNTKTLVGAIENMATRIVDAITGQPDPGDPTTKGSGHSQHMDPRDFGRQIVDAIVTHSRNFLPNNRRQMG